MKFKTTYPEQPIKNYEAWRAWIKAQVLDAKTKRIINQFKQDIRNARTIKPK